MNENHYNLAAIILGFAWYAALYPFAAIVLADTFPLPLALMCLTSLTVARLFRRQIIDANDWQFHALAWFLPSVGAFLFGGYFALVTVPFGGLLGLIGWPLACVVFGAWLLCFVTVPMGYVSQCVMQTMGMDEWGDGEP